MSNEEKVQWTLDLIIRLKNAGVGDSKKLDGIKHLLENGKPISSKEIVYLREKFEELKENTESAPNDSNRATGMEEPDTDQSDSKSKMALTQFALAIILVGATLFIDVIVLAAVYESPLETYPEFFIGIIIMIIGGIVAVIGRVRRKKQPLPESKSKKKITQFALAIILVGATLFIDVIVLAAVYESPLETYPEFFIGIIIMIIGGIVAGIHRLQRKKQHLPEPQNAKKQTQQSSPEIKDTGQTQPPIVEENEIIRVLKMRFAKGEITKEEFDKMKEDLKD